LSRDPTGTTTLRNRYAQRLRGGFGAVMSAARRGIVERDVFRLTSESLADAPDVFRFNRDDRKVDAFMEWWRRAENQDVMSLVSRNDNKWVRPAYMKGVEDAQRRLARAGVELEGELTATRLRRITNLTIHKDALELAYTRNFRELEGITEAVDQQISRELAEGLAAGHNPRKIADNISDRVQKIGKKRATDLARTEVINTYNDAALNRYQETGVDRVKAEVEGVTAGDARVCSECASLQGSMYSIEEARGMLPRHVRCRCTWVPTAKT